MRIRTVVIHGSERYESALGGVLDKHQFDEVKKCMAQQMPITALNIEDKDGNQLYFGKKIIEESIVKFEIVDV